MDIAQGNCSSDSPSPELPNIRATGPRFHWEKYAHATYAWYVIIAKSISCIHIHTRIYTYIHTYTYIYIYIYMYTSAFVCRI